VNDDRSAIAPGTQRLLDDFDRRPGTPRELIAALRLVVAGSPSLADQIGSAVSRGQLTRLALLPAGTNALGEYHAPERLIKLGPEIHDSLATTAFVLGH